MSEVVASLLVVAIAVFALREPYLRSLRTVALAGASLALSLLLIRSGTTPGVVAGALVALVPLVVVLWFQRYITALPSADFAEHEVISDARATLRRAGDFDEAADAVLSQLATSPPPAPEWDDVRRALVTQITMVRNHAAGSQTVAREEASASWQRTVDAWKRAIAARRRFLR